MRLIDADATIKYVRELDDTPLYYVRDIIDTVEYFLDEDISPTIDAVPVIRCKDCKFFISEGHYCKIRGIGRPLEPDDFCSDGMAVK